MSSIFDPAKFAEAAVTDAGSTSVKPIPAGEYLAIIDTANVKAVNTKNGQRVVLDVDVKLQDAALEASLGRAPKAKTGIFLDVDSNGALDMSEGKNVQLNRLRAAVNMNEKGKVFKIPMLAGQPVKVKITLRPDNNSPDVIYNDIASFAKA